MDSFDYRPILRMRQEEQLILIDRILDHVMIIEISDLYVSPSLARYLSANVVRYNWEAKLCTAIFTFHPLPERNANAVDEHCW